MRLKFQAKVLLPVISIMVLLMAGFMWIVSQRMSAQLQSSSAESLTTAEAVFRNLHSLHAKNLALRFRNVPNEPRFKAILQRMDPKTIAVLLKELLDELEGDVVVFSTEENARFAQGSRSPGFDQDEFAMRTAGLVKESLSGQGQPAQTTVAVGSRLYDVLSIPVTGVGQEVLGTLTFGIEIGDDVVREFKAITRSEILLLAGEQIAATTLPATALPDDLQDSVTHLVHRTVTQQGADANRPDTVLIHGEHFMFVARNLGNRTAGPNLKYLLLSSYEKPWRELRAIQRTFLWIQLAGILVGGALVYFLVRRVTSPLRQLRDSAEAVGCGDFSRRVEIQSQDECGELAAVFNRMTANLKASRQELEKAVETLKNTQAQLIQSEKLRAIGTLAGGIAHDFNNILGAILGFGELAIEDVPAESRTARNLKQVIKAGHRAKDLVRQILAFSRQNDPERVTVRLSGLIDETLKLLRATIPTTVEIRTALRTKRDVVIADPTQMHQVLMNLGTNASHAMREKGGALLIALDEVALPNPGLTDPPALPDGEYLQLSVSDTGHGMTPEVLQRIFEPFFTTKAVGEGTGLGLSVVHGIVKSHGGEITVRSEPGVGTTFLLYLPRAAAAQEDSSRMEEPIPGRSERILVVDDEEALVNLMHQRLTRLGYEVVAHCDSLAAFREFQAAPGRFDVVITDQTMPHLTGDDLARKINGLRPEMPVILCSGSGHALLQVEGKCEAVRQCVAKPVNFVELSRRIRAVLESSADPGRSDEDGNSLRESPEQAKAEAPLAVS